MDPNAPGAGVDVAVGGRVAVFRALPGLGDFLCAVPALRAIRTNRPDVEVTLIGLRRTAPLARRFERYVDRFVPFPGFPGLVDAPADVGRIPGFLASMQSCGFDLAIQLHGDGRVTNLVTELLGAGQVVGHHPAESPPPHPTRFVPWIEECSEVRRSLRLIAQLGWPSEDERLEFPIAPHGEPEAADLGARDALGTLRRPFACLHPGASVAARRWPAASFAAVGDRLSEAGLGVVVTGSVDERPIARAVVEAMRFPALDLAGRTTLDALAVVLRRSALLVCNDTGVSHLAAALGVPSVVIFRDSSPERWAPLDRTRHRVSGTSVSEVVRHARELLGGRSRAA